MATAWRSGGTCCRSDVAPAVLARSLERLARARGASHRATPSGCRRERGLVGRERRCRTIQAEQQVPQLLARRDDRAGRRGQFLEAVFLVGRLLELTNR